jgi:hypothetical protein
MNARYVMQVVVFSQWTGMLDLVETMIETVLVQKTEPEGEAEGGGSCKEEKEEEEVSQGAAVSSADKSMAAQKYCSSATSRSRSKFYSAFESKQSRVEAGEAAEGCDRCRFGLRYNIAWCSVT